VKDLTAKTAKDAKSKKEFSFAVLAVFAVHSYEDDLADLRVDDGFVLGVVRHFLAHGSNGDV